MDKPEEPEEDPEMPHEESQIHDLNDHQLVWGHDPVDDAETQRLALAELEATDAGPLPNFTQSLSQGSNEMEKFDDMTDLVDAETPPEEYGIQSDVVDDPRGSYTESKEDLIKDD